MGHRFPGRRSLVVLAAVAVAACAAVGIARATRTDRVWAFVPVPPWSEDPPPCVALERGGAPLPRDRWNLRPVTQSGGAPQVVIAVTPPAFWSRVAAALGLRRPDEQFVSTGPGIDAPGGRWYECVRAAPAPSPGR